MDSRFRGNDAHGAIFRRVRALHPFYLTEKTRTTKPAVALRAMIGISVRICDIDMPVNLNLTSTTSRARGGASSGGVSP